MVEPKLFDYNSSFSVLRTNPKITGNLKITVDSKGAVSFNSFSANTTLSLKNFKKFNVTGKNAFNVDYIHSEYGMTELLSQAYSKKNGLFQTPPWMKLIVRDFEDPYSTAKINNSGGINIIDLANIYSCSFIETQDIGREVTKGKIEILGRFDQSEIRGCNLLSF